MKKKSMREGVMFSILPVRISNLFSFTAFRRKQHLLMLGIGIGCLSSMSLYAQQESNFAIELVNRVARLEAEQRDIFGLLEETRHTLSLLQQKVDTLNADIDYRLSPSEKKNERFSAGGPQLEEGEKIDLSFFPPSPSQEYQSARTLLEKENYQAAEKAFSTFLEKHPKHEKAEVAQYWLAITYFVRDMYEKAAAFFAKGYKSYPKGSKTPERLLKLAKCLTLLKRTSDACATLDQLTVEFPKIHVKEVAQERSQLKCK